MRPVHVAQDTPFKLKCRRKAAVLTARPSLEGEKCTEAELERSLFKHGKKRKSEIAHKETRGSKTGMQLMAWQVHLPTRDTAPAPPHSSHTIHVFQLFCDTQQQQFHAPGY